MINSESLDPLCIEQLGTVEYSACLAYQRELHARRVASEIGDTLLLCSHDPVITCGRSTQPAHITTPTAEIAERGVAFVEVERGGSITYHGPEQIVGYPILDLKQHKQDVGWYVRSLEEVIIRTLHDLGIQGLRVSGKTGVWVEEDAKIAFIGVKISRWCTFHGFSLNVLPCQHRFGLIDPCGLGAIKIVSISELLHMSPRFDTIESSIVGHFKEIFGCPA